MSAKAKRLMTFLRPRTPIQRTMDSKQFPEDRKIALQDRKTSLNPFQLQKGLQLKLREFEERLRKRNTGLMAA